MTGMKTKNSVIAVRLPHTRARWTNLGKVSRPADGENKLNNKPANRPTPHKYKTLPGAR